MKDKNQNSLEKKEKNMQRGIHTKILQTSHKLIKIWDAREKKEVQTIN